MILEPGKAQEPTTEIDWWRKVTYTLAIVIALMIAFYWFLRCWQRNRIVAMAREKITALKKIIIPSSDGSGATTSEVVGTEGAGIALPWIQPPQNPFIDDQRMEVLRRSQEGPQLDQAAFIALLRVLKHRLTHFDYGPFRGTHRCPLCTAGVREEDVETANIFYRRM